MSSKDENNQAMEEEPTVANALEAADDSVPLAKRTKINTPEATSNMELEQTVTMPATLPNEDEVLVQVRWYRDIILFGSR